MLFILGKMKDRARRYFYSGLGFNLLGCTMGVVAMPYAPFVIDNSTGFEVEILKDIGNTLNINFNITLANFSEGWGYKTENNTWSGSLKYIYDDMYIGIGNIDTGMHKGQNAFDFSQYYHMEPLVLVVPIAKYVPKWRVLVAIFTVQMWGICLATIVIFAIAFYCTSKYTREIHRYKRDPFLSSYEIFIAHSVSRQPIGDISRVYFLSLSIFSIIIYSSYTCSLAYYLKNPIREKQPSTFADIYDDFGHFKYYVGGKEKYREMFNVSGNPLYDIYKSVDGVNDTIIFWLRRVAKERDLWTISSSFYANYLISNGSKEVCTDDGMPQIFVFKEKIISYPISMMFRKGHPLLYKISDIIQRLLYGGLVDFRCEKYLRDISKAKSNEIGDDTSLEKLDIDHLQGAFAVLMLGYCGGVILFIAEIISGKRRNARKNKKLVIKRKVRFQKLKSQ